MKIIGMIHLKTLPGYPQHKTMDYVISRAIDDALRLEKGGVDGILVENTDDDPHQRLVLPEIVSAFSIVAQAIKENVSVPIGICVLWNDYRAALGIAKVIGADFVRIPIFIEAAVTASGIIEGNPYDAISYRQKLAAGHIRIMADVQVKHAGHIARRPIAESSREAIHFGADEIIVTGRYTGNAPVIDDLKDVRKANPDAIIAIGSGITPENIGDLKKYADIGIVGTYFKENDCIDTLKVKRLMELAKA
ncbi:MAG: BtpA/SgcQ family protein [Nanoarchaeota archaeon]